MGKKKTKRHPTFIDLFSGCGGLSLGLCKAGWQGVFAVEKDPMAFQTLRENLVSSSDFGKFSWPDWLPAKEHAIESILENYEEDLKSLAGQIDLIAGGPPCQGFSLAGLRNANDPRNKLTKSYLKFVELVSPKLTLFENVRGFDSAFKKPGKKTSLYSRYVKDELEAMGYSTYSGYIDSSEFGVPQKRTRYILIGLKNDLCEPNFDLLERVKNSRLQFLRSKSLPEERVSVKDAISDLEIANKGSKLVFHSRIGGREFRALDYKPPNKLSAYIACMQANLNGSVPNSMRLPNHKPDTIRNFEKIQSVARPGISLSAEEKKVVKTKKKAICVLDPNKPSKTLTTLPDDLIHYSEPRILTVRESARIQSFPDKFRILGQYTTGGKKRVLQCPRYSQVGNAVPPLLAEAIGRTLMSLSIIK